MGRKILLIVLSICIIAGCTYGCTSKEDRSDKATVELNEIINTANEEITELTLYVCLNGEGSKDEAINIKLNTDEGYVVSDEDVEDFRGHFGGVEMHRMNEESYTYNLLWVMGDTKLMFNVVEKTMFFAQQKINGVVTYTASLNDEQALFLAEIEKSI